MSRLRVAVVGVGHLGKEHARILSSLPDVELVGVADVNEEQVRAVAERCSTTAYTDYRQLLFLTDAVVVAVPTFAHFDVASAFLKRDIATFVEKPIAMTPGEAEQLVQLGERNNALLQVGHIERFNPAYEDVEKRSLQPKFVESERLSGFSGRSLDIGVVMDLMIHDLDALLALVRSPVREVDAVGLSLFGLQEDIANARLLFENGCVANLTASRVSQNGSRVMRLFSPEGFVSLDFFKRHATIIQPSEAARKMRPDFRSFDLNRMGSFRENLFGSYLEVQELDLNAGDQLSAELEHFVHCVTTETPPRVSGADGLRAVEVAARILDKINTHQWEGRADGPIGPKQTPAPLGALFNISEEAA